MKMTSQIRNLDVSPVESDLVRIMKRLQDTATSNSPMNDREMAARIATMLTTNICNVNRITLRPLPLYRTGEDAVYVPATDGDAEFLMDANDARTTQVEVQRMTESDLQVFKETALERRI